MWTPTPTGHALGPAVGRDAAGAPVGVRLLVSAPPDGPRAGKVWLRELEGAIAHALAGETSARLELVTVGAPLPGRRGNAGGGADFLLLCRLREAGARVGDSVAAVQPGPQDRRRVSVTPANARRSIRVLLDPPLLDVEGAAVADLTSLGCLVAATAVAMHTASRLDPGGAGGPADLVDVAGRVAGRVAGPLAGPAHALAAWCDAWQGLGRRDFDRLERARSALDERLNGPARGGNAMPGRAGDRGTLALVLLALGGTSEGSRRLAEALGEVRRGLAEAGRAEDRAAVATLTALAGRIAHALGRVRADMELLGEARVAIARAMALARVSYLPGACGLAGLAGELIAVERELRRLAGPAGCRPPARGALLRSGPS